MEGGCEMVGYNFMKSKRDIGSNDKKYQAISISGRIWTTLENEDI